MNATPEIFYFVTGTFNMLGGQPWGAICEPTADRSAAFDAFSEAQEDDHNGICAFKVERTADDGWSTVEITDDFIEEMPDAEPAHNGGWGERYDRAREDHLSDMAAE